MSDRLENWARRLDVIVELSGRIAAWTGLALVLVMAGNVIARYFLHIGSVATQELEWHLMAPLTLLCIAYTIKHDGHVRVDIFYSSLPEIARRVIDLFSALCALALAILIVKISMPYVLQSYRVGEGSPDPGGLPYRWIIKAMIPAGFALFGLQSLASVLRALKPFFGGSDGLNTASINAV